MIQMQTLVDVADNSGAKTARCIRVLGGTRQRTAGIGERTALIGEVFPTYDATSQAWLLTALPPQSKRIPAMTISESFTCHSSWI